MKQKKIKILISILGMILFPILVFKIYFEIDNAVFDSKIKQMADNNEIKDAWHCANIVKPTEFNILLKEFINRNNN